MSFIKLKYSSAFKLECHHCSSLGPPAASKKEAREFARDNGWLVVWKFGIFFDTVLMAICPKCLNSAMERPFTNTFVGMKVNVSLPSLKLDKVFAGT
jgi:hypothetical protein